jgi:hypothetical protein
MKKFFAMLALLGAFFVTAQAADKNPEPETSDPNGQLKGHKAGQPARYVIWYDGTNWNVHMTSPKNDLHAFNATIEAVGGKFTTAQIVKTDNAPVQKFVTMGKMRVPVPPPPIYQQQSDLIGNKAATIFKFIRVTGQGGEVGIQFTANADTTLIKFSTQIDGKDHPDQIFIGATGAHPAKTTFTLPANPPKESKKKDSK